MGVNSKTTTSPRTDVVVYLGQTSQGYGGLCRSKSGRVVGHPLLREEFARLKVEDLGVEGQRFVDAKLLRTRKENKGVGTLTIDEGRQRRGSIESEDHCGSMTKKDSLIDNFIDHTKIRGPFLGLTGPS